MEVLVTGGCGFIGSHVVDALVARGDRVTVLDDLSSGRREHLNPHASLVEDNVTNSVLVGMLVARTDAVIHLAAIASVQVCEHEPARAAQTNVDGTETVFKAASERYIPVVYASSAAVYGDNPTLPLSEDATTIPLSNYGRHKLTNEATARRYADSVPSVGLRFFNVYGPRQDPRSPYSGVISIFMEKAISGNPLTIFGDGEQTRDFIYVGDVVALILQALSLRDGAHVFNGCTGRATSLKNLATLIGQAIAKPTTLAYATARTGDIRHSLGNPKLSDNTLGFKANTDILGGLKLLAGAG